MKLRSFKVLTVIFFLGHWVFGQSIFLTVDNNKVSLDETIELEVRVSGSRNSPQPEIKNVDDFDVKSAGSSSQIQIVNGKSSSNTTYRYELYPKKVGEFKIGPATLEQNGKTLESQTILISVEKTKTNQASKDYEILAFVNETNPYINQQITFTFQFRTKVRIANAQFQSPSFDSFWQENLGKKKEYTEVLNGVTWNVTEIKTALFPSKAGSITIDASFLTGELVLQTTRRRSPFDSFFQRPIFWRWTQDKKSPASYTANCSRRPTIAFGK